MDSLNTPPSLRVLTRPPSSPSITTLPPHFSEGVVVIGFIGKNEEEVTQLMNRVLDDNVFGSGELDKRFSIEKGEGVKDWFKFRKICYFYEEEKGLVFLLFVPTWNLCMDEDKEKLDLVVDEYEFGDLQGVLLMFSVCHVIIFLQGGSHFDTQVLKKFRLLQDAKNALVPFVQAQIKPSQISKSSSSSSLTQPPVVPTSFKNPSPGRLGGNGVTSRHSSAISLMSGSGSHSSLFPGQCTPVLLFVFLDNFSETTNSGSNIEDSAETISMNQSSNISGLPRSSLQIKGSSSVVMLSRPLSKSEGGLRKKLQSSLEAQIRFLIKKCRTLAGSEGSHAGSRGGGNVSSAPLFSLEASRAVALLDRSANQKGQSLDFAAGLVEEVLKSKATSDVLLLESNVQGANKDDIQYIKEFIYRQSDTLRGRGGMVGNANSGSAAGGGMVAVAAAAAAAASASTIKPVSTPELPSMENWLSCSHTILDALLSARHGYLDKSEIIKRRPLRRNSVATQVERSALGGIDPVEAALCWLESNKGLNMKFSTSWCLRALPAAKEVYLKELPSCYPTSLHEAQLEKALHAFHTMVKGPAVQIFRMKLEDECTSIWTSGRQLCDAVSLTGKPCMHQRHTVEGAEVRPHSSGFVFLHACACGRSRRLRDDPFDYDTANCTSNHFPDCDDLLPSLQLPRVSHAGPIQPSSWSLIRVGAAKYYQPSKGLLQSGFCPTEKYLFKWSIFLGIRKRNSLAEGGAQNVSVIRSNMDSKVESVTNGEINKTSSSQLFQGEGRSIGVDNKKKNSENVSLDDKKISFGRGLPHFSMRRPFAEVVAGSIATDTAFPPLQHIPHPVMNPEKVMKPKFVKDKREEHVPVVSNCQESKKCEETSAQDGSHGIRDNRYSEDEPVLQIGSYIPATKNTGEKMQSNPSLKHVIVYVGFEHECSHGHRFLLNSEHLNKLGSFYSLPEDSCIPLAMETLENKVSDASNLIKSGTHEKLYPHSNGRITHTHNMKTSSRSKPGTNPIQHGDRSLMFPGSENGQNQSLVSKSAGDLREGLQYASLDDGGCAFSLLNRNLPVYMNCPHCKNSKKDQEKIKFANTVSQLQRIFLVTPPFPTVIATCPIVQFQESCLPPTVMDRERQSQFSIGCRVILPPDSFLSLRLPFVYGVQDDKSSHPLKSLEDQPELTAWIMKGTTLQVISKESSHYEEHNNYKI